MDEDLSMGTPDLGYPEFVVSHPSRKNKDAARVEQPVIDANGHCGAVHNLHHLHWYTENPVFFDKVLTKIFGTANERLIKRLMPMVAVIGALEGDMKQLSDE
jgi:hypothetical protein